VKAHAFSNLRQTYGVHVFYFKMLPTAKNLSSSGILIKHMYSMEHW